jgi:predicted nucleotidyltransferase
VRNARGARASPTAPRSFLACRIYLFGSVVRPGAFRLDSDVDAGVEGADAQDYFALWRDLEREAPEWTIDLREVSGNPPFAERVRATGIPLYERESSTSRG